MNEQVVGLLGDSVQWWTRTEDGWYVSDALGTLGHRSPRPPQAWQHPPDLGSLAWIDGSSFLRDE